MAGFFGIGDFTKEGRGVDKNGPEKRRFFVFFEIYFRKFWSLCTLNMLYLLFCLPIVTIGPATAAFTYILRNYSREDHAFLFSDFLDIFKKNWKQSSIFWFLNLFCVIALYIAIPTYFVSAMEDGIYYIPFLFCSFGALLLLFMNYYAYVMIVTFKLNLKQIIKNAFIFAISCLGTNLIITFWIVVASFLCFVLGFILIPLGVLLTLAVYFSLVGLIINFNVYPLLVRYIIEPYERDHPEEKKQTSQEESIFSDQDLL